MSTICYITPSFNSGGAERVLSELANYTTKKENVIVHLIILTGGTQFYKLNPKIKVHTPNFNYKKFSRIVFFIKIFWFLRATLKEIKPTTTLSFGGKYNSFSILATLGLNIPIYVSDRSKPGISYGKFQDLLNPYVYKLANGIIAQTTLAKEDTYKKTRHKNITIINNPIRKIIGSNKITKENIILNVGRFIPSKQQSLLLDLFEELQPENWKLIFIGDGPELDKVKDKAQKLTCARNVFFLGNIKNIEEYYLKSKIFAFTSISEGFPNALGEAMSAGCACISFDCNAGPSDLIDQNISGILIPEKNNELYKEKLNQLINNNNLITDYSVASTLKASKLSVDVIGDKFYNFILGK